jgi:hypothetical protein
MFHDKSRLPPDRNDSATLAALAALKTEHHQQLAEAVEGQRIRSHAVPTAVHFISSIPNSALTF